MFDPDQFINSTAGAGATKVEPIPAGTYPAQISKTEAREVDTKRGKSVVLDVTFTIMDPTLEAKIGRANPTIREGFFLDLDGKGGLDMGPGKNVRLNRLREALGQNTAGWRPAALNGGLLQVVVGLRPDPQSPDVVYNQITSFGKYK